jgi:homopolymeric O-antigen transport system ATP-binding protein
MSTAAIQIENLGKQYRLGGREPYRTLREGIARAVTGPFRSGASKGAGEKDKDLLWALREVSFAVGQGEVLGIIGRNGAGKSTLLKVLSRITEPTEGWARIRGRVGSLLEVGTGFHPELTGRENIYLNGAILGMRRLEIRRKFDDIVSFAEVERFLDTPVKRYSSGMYVRLAFAVAAHLETEVLLVDEVLAVGDARFQRKCLGKMSEIGKQGRTVLFVSHAMAAVQSLCTRGIVLQAGRVDFDGSIEGAVEGYLRSGVARTAVQDLTGCETRGGNGDIRLTRFWLEDASTRPSSAVSNGRSCTCVLAYRVATPGRTLDGVAASVSVRNILGTRVFYHHNLLTGQSFDGVSGEGQFRLRIPRLPLSAGDYHVDLHLTQDRGRTLLDSLEGECGFEVCDGDFFGTGFEYRGGLNAAVLVDGTWDHQRADARRMGGDAEQDLDRVSRPRG